MLGLVLNPDELLDGVVRAVVGHRQNAVGGSDPRADPCLHRWRLHAISVMIENTMGDRFPNP